jgi:hypothetical protein
MLRLGKEGWVEYSVVKINNIEYHCFKKPKRFSSYVQNSDNCSSKNISTWKKQ